MMHADSDVSLAGDSPPLLEQHPRDGSTLASTSLAADSQGVDASVADAVTFYAVNDANLPHLKALNRAIFPVAYKDKFYQDCTAFEEVTQLAFYHGEAVGGVACRLERCPKGHPGEASGSARLYIMTLGLLAPYRGLGIGSSLLRRVLAAVEFDAHICEAYLHVQTSNEEALRFYAKAGFTVTDTIRNYYKRLQPPDCHVLTRRLPHAILWSLPEHRTQLQQQQCAAPSNGAALSPTRPDSTATSQTAQAQPCCAGQVGARST